MNCSILTACQFNPGSMKLNLIRFCALVFAISTGTSLQIQAQNSDVPQVTSTYALTNATVIVSPGQMLSNTTVIVEDGLIKAVGAKVNIPLYAKTIPCDSMYIYAGFIEGISHTGIPKPENEERPRVDDPGNPPNDVAGITPELQVKDLYSSSDKSVSAKRKLGFTAAHVVPEKGMLPGKGSLMLLGDGDADRMVMKEDVSLFLQLTPARRMYPGTIIGVMAKFRDMYRNAELSKGHSSKYSEDGSGLRRPEYDRATEALFPVVSGDLPVFFKTPNSLHAHKAFMLQDELGFDLVLCELDEAWRLMDELKETGTPIMLTVDLPDEADEKSEEDLEAMTAEDKALMARRDSVLKTYVEQAARLAEADIPFGFSFLEVKDKDFKANVRRMIEHGLQPQHVLAALTTTPAEMMGVDRYMGTVEAGKMANLVVSTGRYFAEDSQVKYVFVEGDMNEYEVKDKKKKKEKKEGEDEKPASIVGTWSFEVEVPGETQSGTLVFSGTDGDYEGELSAADDDFTTDLDNIEINGSNVTFTSVMDADGQTITLQFDIEVIDGSFEGRVTAGPMGSFPIEGEFIPKN